MDQKAKASYLEGIEKGLQASIEGFDIEAHLKRAILHTVFPAGKRIRPLFAATVCKDLGGNPESYVPHFCALEFIHNSSLIHDDLPCLDNDDIRRGRPTCHKEFGEATALLAGDALVALAFSVIAEQEISASDRVALINSLSSAYLSLCNGQQLDILSEQKRGEIKQIHFKKTGALFGSSFEFGAIAAGASSSSIKSAFILGEWFGFAFQVLDDFLDIYGDPELRGRPVGSDQRNDKKTFFSGRNFRDALIEVDEILSTLKLHTDGLRKFSPTYSLTETEALIASILDPLTSQLHESTR